MRTGRDHHFLAALLLGNICMAFGPVLVRLAGTNGGIGPIAAGFWRMALALPLIALAAPLVKPPAAPAKNRDRLILLAAGVVLAAGLASWNLGIERTRLGNAALWGNMASVFFPAWGFLVMRLRPSGARLTGFTMAIVGAVIMLGRSAGFGRSGLLGDALCLLAGAIYTVYLVAISHARANVAAWSTLLLTTLAAAPVLLGLALASGEVVWPANWAAPIALALLVQLVGQALLILSIGKIDAVLVGITFLIQPLVGSLIGWLGFNERITLVDSVGMAMICAAIVLIAYQPTTSPNESPAIRQPVP